MNSTNETGPAHVWAGPVLMVWLLEEHSGQQIHDGKRHTRLGFELHELGLYVTSRSQSGLRAKETREK